jgi:PPM family protein phosphatase
MRFSVYQVSRRGGREKNEDRMGYCYTREAGLFALADGMGGHPEGEVAAQIALQTLAALFQREAKPSLKEPLRFLHDAIYSGHHQLLRYASERNLPDTPRTTVVACLLQGNAAYWAHCGDSRLYLLRGDKLVARTRDHSYTELPWRMSCPLASASTATCSSPAWAAPASPWWTPPAPCFCSPVTA